MVVCVNIYTAGNALPQTTEQSRERPKPEAYYYLLGKSLYSLAGFTGKELSSKVTVVLSYIEEILIHRYSKRSALLGGHVRSLPALPGTSSPRPRRAPFRRGRLHPL